MEDDDNDDVHVHVDRGDDILPLLAYSDTRKNFFPLFRRYQKLGTYVFSENSGFHENAGTEQRTKFMV